MSDLEFTDTPALEVLRRLPEGQGVAAADITAAQDLLRLSKRLLGSFGEQFAMHGLSPGRYAVLMALYARPASLAPSEIADRLGVTRATITGLISGLVRDGLVVFAPTDDADRRRKAIALTERGRGLLGEVVPDIFARMAGLLAPLSVEERSALAAIIRKLEGALGDRS